MSLIDNQVRSLRKRQLIASYVRGERDGAYWGIRTDVSHYDLDDTLDCPRDRTLELANTKTRLKRLSDTRQDRLINWGYAVCDAAMRAHVETDLQPPPGFPYPDAAV
jgi:NTE family protein